MDAHQLIRLKENEKLMATVKGSSIQVKNDYQQTLLHEAVAFSNEEIIPFLLQSGVPLNETDYEGKTALHYAVEHNNSAIVTLLIDAGADVNIADNFGNNATWKATFNARGDYNIVDIVLSAGGDPNHKNNSGRSALDFAKQIDDRILVVLLER